MPQVINLRGTSGSGKSFIVHQLKAAYPSVIPEKVSWREQPMGYVCAGGDGLTPTFLAGHYESPCGGCDTFDSIDESYKYINRYLDKGYNVVFEGLVVQSDVTRCLSLKDKGDLHVVFLTVPIDVCLTSVMSRREERGTDGEFNPRNTLIKAMAFPAQKKRFNKAGVDIYEYDRNQALQFAKNALGLSNETMLPEAVRYPSLRELLGKLGFALWLNRLITVFEQGTMSNREDLGLALLMARSRLAASPHNVSEFMQQWICQQFPIYKNRRTEIDRPGTNIDEMVQGVEDCAWQFRRRALRKAYIENTVLSARTEWANWEYARAIDAIAAEILTKITEVTNAPRE